MAVCVGEVRCDYFLPAGVCSTLPPPLPLPLHRQTTLDMLMCAVPTRTHFCVPTWCNRANGNVCVAMCCLRLFIRFPVSPTHGSFQSRGMCGCSIGFVTWYLIFFSLCFVFCVDGHRVCQLCDYGHPVSNVRASLLHTCVRVCFVCVAVPTVCHPGCLSSPVLSEQLPFSSRRR
jgi:hypothetical protein